MSGILNWMQRKASANLQMNRLRKRPVVSVRRKENTTNVNQKDKPNAMKYLRYAIGAILIGNLIHRSGFNPMSMNGGTPFTLNVEPIHQQSIHYRTKFRAVTKGTRNALLYREILEKEAALGVYLRVMTPEQLKQLDILVEAYRIQNEQLNNRLANIQAQLNDARDVRRAEFKEHLAEIAAKTNAALAADSTLQAIPRVKIEFQEIDTTNLKKSLEIVFAERAKLEVDLVMNLEKVLASNVKTLALLEDKPLVDRMKNTLLGVETSDSALLMAQLNNIAVLPTERPGRAFVLRFNGNTTATGLALLREEVNAVLSLIDEKRVTNDSQKDAPVDRVIVEINSPGGTVTGYGAAAAQLARFKAAKIPLTVVVDQVAASGGYMMAAVADRIVASPFAILGSIGVVATAPNFTDRLNREGISVEDFASSELKRSVAPYKKSTPQQRAQFEASIAAVHNLFKNFLAVHRPSLDLSKVATGETWYGKDALERGLADELHTPEEEFASLAKLGYQLFRISVTPTPKSPFDAPVAAASAMMSDWAASTLSAALSNLIIGGLTKNASAELVDSSLRNQFLALDDSLAIHAAMAASQPKM